MRIIFARVIEDRLEGCRVLVIHGRDLLVNTAYPKDPEYWAYQRHPNYQVGAVAKFSSVSSAGVQTNRGMVLEWINRDFWGDQPAWEMARAQRFRIPNDLASPNLEVTYVRNDGQSITFPVVVPPKRALPSGFRMYRTSGTLVVPAGQTLSGYLIDHSRTSQSAPAVVFEEGSALVDSKIIVPYGLAIGGAGILNVRMEGVEIQAHTISELTRHKPCGGLTLFDVLCKGRGGFRAGGFGNLLSGHRHYAEQLRILDLGRGPESLKEFAESLFVEVDLFNIGPPSNGESETWVLECPESEYPEKLEWLSPTRLRCELRSRMWLGRVGQHVLNRATREVAEVIECKGNAIPGTWEFTLSKPIGSGVAGSVRVGPGVVGNTWARCQARDTKHLLSFAGPSIDNQIIDSRTWDCVETISYNLGRSNRPAGDLPAFNESFGWEPKDNWRNVIRFPGSMGCERGAYCQPTGPRKDPLALVSFGYEGELRHLSAETDR